MNKTDNMQHRVSLQWEEICYDGMQAFYEGLSLIAVRTERENRTWQWAQNCAGYYLHKRPEGIIWVSTCEKNEQTEGVASERPIVRAGILQGPKGSLSGWRLGPDRSKQSQQSCGKRVTRSGSWFCRLWWESNFLHMWFQELQREWVH